MLSQLHDICEKKRELEKQYQALRGKLITQMTADDVKEREEDGYIAKMKTRNSFRISKKYCPSDVWNRYAKMSTYTTCTISKKK